MTLINFETVTCPYCGKENNVDVYQSVNVSLDPGLRRKILEDRLNKFVCRECLYESELIFDFMYHDMNNKFVIFYSKDEERIKEQLKMYEEFEFNEFEKHLGANYFKKATGARSWRELKNIIKSNEALSGTIEIEKKQLKQLSEKDMLEFYNYTIRRKKLLNHSDLHFFIDSISEESGIKKVIEKKINNIRNSVVTEFSKSAYSKNELITDKESFHYITNNNIMSEDNGIIIPADKNEFGIEIIDIKRLNFLNYMREFTEEEKQDFLKYRALGISQYVTGIGMYNPAEAICMIEYPDSDKFKNGREIISNDIYDKWDFSINKENIKILDSMTGEYIYDCSFKREDGKLILYHIYMNSELVFYSYEFNVLIVDFLIKTCILGMNSIFPIPESIERNIRNIVYYGLKLFGGKAEYGSFEKTVTKFFDAEPMV